MIDMNNLGLDNLSEQLIRGARPAPETPTLVIPEDSMLLFVDIAYKEEGTWNTVQLRRAQVTDILNGNNVLDAMPIFAICIATFEGTDCDLRYVYYFSTKTWEIV